MFVLGKERRAWWPVKWMGAAEDGGELVENRIEMQFRLLDVDQLQALQPQLDAADAPPVDGEKAKRLTYADVVLAIATNWRGVGGENGEPLPWSEENVGRLMGVPGLFAIVVRAFGGALAGRAEVREGN